MNQQSDISNDSVILTQSQKGHWKGLDKGDEMH